jgi:hypothetical protein
MADANNTVSVDPTVSIATHPLTLSPEGKVLGEHPAFKAATESFVATYEVLSQMSQAHRAAIDENQVRNAQAIDVAKRTGTVPPNAYMSKEGVMTFHLDAHLATSLNDSIVKAWDERLAPKLDGALKVVRQARDALAVEVAKATRDPRGDSLPALHYGTEVRSHIKSLPVEKRGAFVREAIANGDVAVVSAVINTSAFLSGINPKEMAVLKSHAELKFAPEQAKQLAALTALDSKFIDAGKAALAHRLKMTVPIRLQQGVTLKAMNALRNGGAAK